jgi:hypothetical protein
MDKVFFVVLLTMKFPNAILFSLAKTTPSSKVIPTAVAPGIYIDIFQINLSHNKGLSTIQIKFVAKI